MAVDFRKLSDLTVAEFRALMADLLGAAPKAPSAPPAASGGGTLPNYGRAKGQPIHGASLDDLRYYARGCERTLADASKARWHDRERAMLAAIEQEIARQSGGGSDPVTAAQDAFGGSSSFGAGSDEDVPFITCAGSR